LDLKTIWRSAAVEFTNIDKSFLQYKLECSGIGPYLAGKVQVQFGTGTGPTWLTAPADYVSGGTYQNLANATPLTFISTTTGGMALTDNQWGVVYGNINGNQLTARFGPLWYAGSNSQQMLWQASYQSATGFMETSSGVGYTGNTAAPITAIRILSADAGSVNGNCHLQGVL
jgi:hypothetical protein